MMFVGGGSTSFAVKRVTGTAISAGIFNQTLRIQNFQRYRGEVSGECRTFRRAFFGNFPLQAPVVEFDQLPDSVRQLLDKRTSML